jgi:CheY-like chemotaxis protein
MTIILIDDDNISNLVAQRALEKQQPKVKIKPFMSAVEALFYLQKPDQMPNLILLDINMPEMNAWAFLDAYRLKYPIVILTSSVDEEDKALARKYPIVKEFITKPLDDFKLKRILSFL